MSDFGTATLDLMEKAAYRRFFHKPVPKLRRTEGSQFLNRLRFPSAMPDWGVGGKNGKFWVNFFRCL